MGILAVPDEAQSMPLILVEGLFSDGALAVNGSHYAMFLARSVPCALVLRTFVPFMVRGPVAGLRSGEGQVRADLIPECNENLNGHPICGLPFGKCTFASPVRKTDQHGVDQLLLSTVRVMYACKWHMFIVKRPAY